MRSRMTFLVGCIVVSSACGGSTTTSSTTTTTTTTTTTNPVVTTSVAMSGSSFSPQAIQVSPSAVVTFTNNDNTAHNVTFTQSGIANITDFSTGSKTTTMPTTPGDYNYRCTIHSGMTGTVKVQ